MRDSKSAMAMDETATNVGAKEEEEDPLGICFWVGREDIFCDWYVIKSDDTRDGKFLHPEFSDLYPIVGGLLNGTTCVVLGSVLYVFGGQRFSAVDTDEWMDPYRQVFCIDTLHSGRGWTRLPVMSMGRINAKAFTLHGKIYVVGGYRVHKSSKNVYTNRVLQSNFDYYVEVFDPEEAESTRCWRPATNICNSIPDDFKGHVIEAFQIKETKSGDCVLKARLINHTMDVQLLVEYNFNTNIWRTCSDTNNFGTSYGARNVIFVDDILYSYVKNAKTYLRHQSYCEDYNITRCSILCFDSNKPQAKPKEVIFSEKDLNLLPQPYDEEWNLYAPANFLHLSGTNFCLIWCHQQEWVGPNGDDYQLGVTCLKFTVSKKPLPLTSSSSSSEEQQVDFVASNMSQSVHLVNGMRVLGATAMSTSKGST